MESKAEQFPSNSSVILSTTKHGPKAMSPTVTREYGGKSRDTHTALLIKEDESFTKWK